MGKKDGEIQDKLCFRRTIAAKWEKRTAKSKENRILAVLSKQAAKTKNLTNSELYNRYAVEKGYKKGFMVLP